MKIYRNDAAAPLWMQKTWMPKYAPKGNCPQCRGEIRVVRESGSGSLWRCTSCRVELDVNDSNEIVSARNLQSWQLGPPTILCSQCGVPLVKADDGFSCKPCGREVRA